MRNRYWGQAHRNVSSLFVLSAFILAIVLVQQAGESIVERAHPPYDAVGSGKTHSNFQSSLLFSIIDGEDGDVYFPGDVGSLGDINGDGMDDLCIQPRILEYGPFPGITPPFEYTTNITYREAGILFGRGDRDYNFSQIRPIIKEKGFALVGDVNGDSISDMISFSYIGWSWMLPLMRVFLGSPSKDFYTPGSMIDCTPVGAKMNCSINCRLSGVGDINSDGYDDVCVFCHGRTSENDTYPSELQLFLGSPSGLTQAPSKRFTIPSTEDELWYWLDGIAKADVNGDGFSDVLFMFVDPRMSSSDQPREWNHPLLTVHFGSSSGIGVEPNQSLFVATTNPTILVFRGILHFNRDDCDDLAIAHWVYPWPNGEIISAEELVLQGSPSGLGRKVDYHIEGLPLAFNDINGDGLDDLTTRTIQSVDPNDPNSPGHNLSYKYPVFMNCTFNYYLNAETGFPSIPTYSYSFPYRRQCVKSLSLTVELPRPHF